MKSRLFLALLYCTIFTPVRAQTSSEVLRLESAVSQLRDEQKAARDAAIARDQAILESLAKSRREAAIRSTLANYNPSKEVASGLQPSPPVLIDNSDLKNLEINNTLLMRYGNAIDEYNAAHAIKIKPCWRCVGLTEPR